VKLYIVIWSLWFLIDTMWLFDRVGWKKTAPEVMNRKEKRHWRRICGQAFGLFAVVSAWSLFDE
jgi:hypothetical protein